MILASAYVLHHLFAIGLQLKKEWSLRGWCYISKLGSGCNLGKDLSKREENDQLVKYKDTGLYLSNDNKERKRHSWRKQWGKHRKNIRWFLLLYKMLTNIL